MKFFVLLILTAFFMFGCVVDQGKVAVDIKRKIKEATSPSTLASANVSNIQIINNQLVITGSGLSAITSVKVDGNSLNQNFTIETKSATQIIANAVSAFSFDVSKVFNLIISDASASATFPIDFSLCNATLNGKAFNCAITAVDKDVLSYDAVSGKWKPRSINGLSYQGTWDASTTEPAGASAGDYYIVSIASAPYAVGDWIVWNGTGYDKISNSTTITSVFGRSGAITATKGDYDLNKMFDVDLTVPPTIGKVLKYDGSKWIAGDDLSGGGAGSITTAELADGSVTDPKIVGISASKITGTITSTQILDGTIVNADINAAAAIDYSKLNIPAGSIAYSKLNIANGDIPAAKISGLTAATSVLATTIVDSDSTHAPDGNAVFDALALKLNTTGGTLSVGTITGVPTPVNPSDVASKSYVDSTVAAATPSLDTDDITEATNLYFTEPRVRGTVLTGLTTGVAGPISATDTVLGSLGKLQYQVTDLKSFGQWTKSGSDILYSAGDVEIDKNLKLKDSTTNYVLLKAPSAVTTYTLTMPAAKATSAGQALTSDTSGVLSWTTISDSSVQAFAKSALPTCASGEVLKSNGTSFSCVTDLTGAGSFTGSTSRAVATDGSGALTTSTTTATELGYVNGVTSSIQTQLNAKEGSITAGTAAQYLRGDKTWATFTNDVLGTAITGLSIATSSAITATDTTLVAFGKLQAQISGQATTLSGKADQTNLTQTITAAAVTGLSAPSAGSDAANKTYVDNAVAAATPSLDTDDVTEATNLYFTEARVRGTALTGLNTGVAGPITATDTVLGSLGKLQYQVTDLKSYGQWTKTVNDLSYSAGDVTVEKNFKLKDSGTNFVLFKAPATISTTYTLTMPTAKATSAGQALTSDTSGVLSWTTISDASVQAFAKSALPTCSAGQVLKSDGTSFSCVTDATGAGAFTGTASRAIASDGSGALTVSTTTATELGYVNGVTSSIQTQLNAKEGSITAGTSSQYYRGDKTWATLDTSIVPENTNLYFTQARAIASPLTGFSATNSAITATDTVLQGFNKAQGQISANATSLASKADLTNVAQTITAASITGLTTPVAGSDAANKTYVDTQIESTPGLGIKIPANSVMLMQACPSGWSSVGTMATGPSAANCGSTSCIACQSPATSSDLPASSTILMENCPSGWTTYGGNIGNANAGIGGVNYLSCQSPATNVLIPQGAKIYMGISCPTNWTDMGSTSAGPMMASSTLGAHHVCQAPGLSIPVRTVVGSTAATTSGGSVYVQGGGGVSGGAISITAGLPTESTGANVVITASSGGSATSTARDGGSVSIGAGNGVNNGSGGSINLNVGNLSGTGSNGAVLIGSGNLGIGISSPTEKLDVSGNANLTGKLRLKDSGTNYVELKAPSTVTSTYTLTFPATAGSSNQVLTTDGAGVLSWTTPATGGAPSGAAGGDLTGTFPNPTISALAATKIGSGAVDNTEFSYLDGVTSSIQTQLNGKQPLDATLTSLAAFNTNGILVQTAADTFVGRSIAGTSNRLTVTNGDGVAGNPTINIPTALLPSPVLADAGKFLKATAADTSVWTALGLSDITTALGYTPVNKGGDTISSGTITFNGTGILSVPTPVSLTDAVNKQYVDTQVSTGANQWTLASGNVYRSTGNVGIGTISPAALLDVQSTDVNPEIRITNLSSTAARYPALAITNYTGGNGGTAAINLYTSRGSSASPAAVQSGDILSTIQGWGQYDTTATHFGAGSMIQLQADGAFSSSTVHPGRIIMATAGASGGQTERMRIDSNGNVGIGTTAANSILNLNTSSSAGTAAAGSFMTLSNRNTTTGTFAAGGILSDTYRDINNPSFTAGMWFEKQNSAISGTAATQGAIVFGSQDQGTTSLPTERMRVTPTGAVGIGTPAPMTALHVARDNPGGWASGMMVQSSGTVAGTSGAGHIQAYRTRGTIAAPTAVTTADFLGALDFAGWGTSAVIGSAIEGVATETWSGTATGSMMIFKTSANGTYNSPGERMRIDQNGNVGIGMSPAVGSKVQIKSIGTDTSPILVTNSANQPMLQVYENNASHGQMLLNDGAGTTKVWLSTSTNSYFTGGNVGIGTTAPTLPLTVTGATAFGKIYSTANNAANTADPSAADIVIGSNSITGATRHDSSIMMWSAGSASRIYSASDVFYFSPWSSNPTTGANVALAATIGGTSTFSGAIQATSFVTTSDRRLKKNIITIDNSLEKILGLRGVEFDWKNDGKHEIGLIAQEVESIEPTLVYTREDGFKGVKYSNIVALLIEAMKLEHQTIKSNIAMMKAMQSTVEDHGRRIASIEVENAQLKAELNTQKKELSTQKQENIQLKKYLCQKDPKAPFCH